MTSSSGTALLPIPDLSAFDTTLSSLPASSLVVLYFHAPWAAPCTQMSAVLSALAATYPAASPPSISFLSLDAEELSDLSERYNVTQVPHLVLQRADGTVLDAQSGGDAARVRALVEKHAGPGQQQQQQGANGAALPPLQHVTPRAPAEGAEDAPVAVVAEDAAGQKEALQARLAELVKAAPVMLFMKGTPSAPQCGFSRQTVAMLRERGIRYGFFNILADDDVRQGLKEYSEWPTFPQVYVGGELVGGLDILKEEFENDPDFLADYTAGRQGTAAAA